MDKTILRNAVILLASSTLFLGACSPKTDSTNLNTSEGSSSMTMVGSSTTPTTSEQTKIPAPVIALNGNVVSWQKVQNARLYRVSVGVDAYETSDLSYTIIKKVPGSWDVRVMAVAQGSNYADSEWSNKVTYALGVTPLATPVLTLIDKTVSWPKIANADAYDIYLNGAKISSQTGMSYLIDKTALGTYAIKIKATSTSALFSESAFSNEVSYKIEAKDLLIPVVVNHYNVFSWASIDNADSYNIYVNGALLKSVSTTSVELDVTQKGSYKVEVEAVSASALFKTSGKSNSIVLELGGEVTEANSVYDEIFTKSIRIDGGTYAVVKVDDATTAKVWLRYFVKSSSTSTYNIKLVNGENEIVVLSSTDVSNKTIDGKGVSGAVTSSTDTGFELAARRFDGNSQIVMGSGYTFIVANETVNTTLTLLDFKASAYPSDVVSETAANYNLDPSGSFLQNIGATSDIYYYNSWIPHSTMAIDFNAWAVVDYNGTFKGVTKANSGQTIPTDLRYQSLSKAIQLPALTLDHYTFGMGAGNVGANESALIWKISAVCEETGKTYIISDWTVNPFAADSTFSWAFTDADSTELSGKIIDLTVQWQRQTDYNDGWKGRAYLSNFAIAQASDPKPVIADAWSVTGGTGSYDASASAAVKSDSFTGLLSVGAGATATLTTTIPSTSTGNVWVSFYAKAATAASATAVPSILFKLSAKIGETSYPIYDWNKLGGTSSTIDNSAYVTSGSVNQVLANDRYEIFMRSLDDIAFGYAGKTATFTLETRDSGDGLTQELSLVGFNLSQYSTKMAVNSSYAGMSEWTSNFTSYVEFANNPIPGGWMRSIACTDAGRDYQYQADSTNVTLPTYTADKTMNFGFTFSNYGNYTSILYKLSAVDDNGMVYVLNDWNYLVGPGSDFAFKKAIPDATAQAISGKSVSLLLQFNDSEKIDSTYNNRMYITNYAFTND